MSSRTVYSGVMCLLAGVLTLVSARVISAQSAAATATDYAQEAVVMEQVKSLFRFETDGTGRREISMRLRIQSEAGVQQFGQLVFGYNSANERQEIAFVRVHKSNGTVVTTPADAVQDLTSPVQRVAPIYTDFRQKHVTVQGLRPGDTLEFSVITHVHTALAPRQFWTEYDFQRDGIVLDEQLDIDIPADRLVTLKTEPGFAPAVKDSEGRRTYHWARARLEREDAEEKEKKSKAATTDPPRAAIRLTTFQSWEQVGQWYAALESPQRMPTPEIRKKAAELIAGRTTDLEKIQALYDFVATNFRYVSLSLGAGRYQPRQAAETLREQYGDCKDKHTLLASLLEAAGLKASAVLINSSVKIDPDFPSPSQFDHVITLANAGGEEVWVDTTSEVAPFRLLWLPLRKKQALVVDAAGTPRLKETPANPPMKSLVSQDIDGTLDASGKLEAHVRLVFRGDSELMMRTAFRATPQADWKTLLERGAVRSFGKAEVTNWKVSDPAVTREPFTLEFDLAVARFANWTTTKIDVSLPLADSLANEDGGSADDPNPVQLGAAPTESTYKLQLKLPKGVTGRAPLPVTLNRDYAEYRTAYTVSDSVFSAERTMVLRQSELPASRRQDYAAFIRVMETDAAQPLGLESSLPITAAVTDGLKSGDLNRRGYEAVESGNYDQAVMLLKRAAELEPKEKYVWTNLGRAYMGLKDTDTAIGAFRKQIDIDPYDAYAYHYLGRAYVQQQKYADAEVAFQKQLEVNPLDKYTHASLADLYVERSQFEKAIPQLEKAIALNADWASLRIQLGKAHLNLKHDAKALAAFDRAVELSPTPTTWNDIAYQLALKGVHLDRALQYAESAVSAATASSRNLDVARADQAALRVVGSLAAYWDTLGWVHFARGDMARAEKLVAASWLLAQHSEVGDHLAQIYEKAERRDDAMRLYAQALAAERPAEETRDRLARLAGGSAKVDDAVNRHRPDLAAMRRFKVDAAGSAGSADIFVLFSSPSTIDSVRFIGGDEALRPLTDAVRKIKVPTMFPDDAPAKLLRRGTLACAPATGCTLTLTLPDDALPAK